ncbi:apoptosis-associated speck-like protein containing a CARD isoform X2 [Myotis lucifugus]|uniref:apoptosis-associated speck-like protein containing a CARD isoform X2 n=1 Tax=Myotis lucifugus TaxID=59463 RepID=UPI000CCC4022|nr:apoptosis-associated speck-like protein containing a CARD isoform X2 [Myotis lucifugus]
MAGTRDAILDALEELTADELKKFKLKLLSVHLRDGYGRIPRGALLPMDAVDLADKLVSCYLEAYAAELTAQVLRDMGMQDTAERLQAPARARGSGAGPAGIQASPPQVPAIPGEAFTPKLTFLGASPASPTTPLHSLSATRTLALGESKPRTLWTGTGRPSFSGSQT